MLLRRRRRLRDRWRSGSGGPVATQTYLKLSGSVRGPDASDRSLEKLTCERMARLSLQKHGIPMEMGSSVGPLGGSPDRGGDRSFVPDHRTHHSVTLLAVRAQAMMVVDSVVHWHLHKPAPPGPVGHGL